MAKIEVGRISNVPDQLAQQLREMIYSGELPEGAKVPSNQYLSKMWQVSRASVQSAMASLVKEGLVHRARKRGTFVAERHQKLTQVGIYLSENIWHLPEAAWGRNAVSILSERLRQRGLEVDIWIDPRPRQAQPWDELVRAIDQRRVQAMMFPNFAFEALPWMEKLPVPWVVMTPARFVNSAYHAVDTDKPMAVEELARQGCRSVGMIVPTTDNIDSDNPSEREYARGARLFARRARELGLDVRDEWVLHPTSERVNEAGSEQYGYMMMKRLLEMPERPQGVYVTHDLVARGAVVAVMESRINVPEDLKLVLHRNLEIGFLCPLKVSFVDFSVTETVDAVLQSMDAQLNGEAITPGQFVVQPKICPAT